MQENFLRLCYDGDPACRVHHTIGRAEDYALMSQFHYDTTLNLLLFLRGHGEIRIEGRLYTFGEGDMIILSPSELHRSTIADDTVFERISLHVSENILNGFGSDGLEIFTAFNERPRGIGNIIRADRLREIGGDRLMKDILAHASGSGRTDPILLRCKTIELLSVINEALDLREETDEAPSIENELVLEILQFLNTHYCEDISLSDVANKFYHSKYHVCHLFREQVGVTVHDYLVLRRIRLVNDLICRGIPAAEACYTAGFGNYSNFFRLYKKYTGMTPAQFKNTLGK
ncbi:MAG: helix-turn-helix transcriptional regulator [Clostridia bacterium]|nr:helix-turn-helix transcriptional regulator [Clostridia bacterium]